MDYAQLYVVFSISVGLLQIFDNVLLIQSKGRLTTPNAVITAIEFAWIIASIMAIIASNGIPRFLPLSFTAFSIAGSLYGVFLLRGIQPADDEMLPSDVVVPLWLAIVGSAFGAYFAVASYLVHQRMFP
ncbi:MAG: hypothetical protein O2960_08510 [Verrucomicrobia bacterium]|nr:hypothetical protein [Verrucomicrobiota bacterium]